ncbi:hypothetical protein B6S08_02395 [Oceanimonas doudoroffii]|uniref:DUF2062 domain-containing protein n=2 Tax=Aeromonadaceae TaxID=84642 RepID=A0A233RK25_9GAMM|nr:hypothetical protein B6S08_02395 [Oceanimonas doudoroffii]
MPSQETLRQHRMLRLFGERLLDPDYWFCNRHSAAVAVAAGLFAAWLPLPMHTLVAIALALLMRGYLPLAIAMVWVNNPLTIAPMFYFAYRLGLQLLGQPDVELSDALSLEQEALAVALPLFTGCLLLALASAALGWVITRLGWRWKVQLAWLRRHQRREP